MKKQLHSCLVVLENQLFPEDLQVELVERKGLGHPDTLADSLAEVVSIAYSRYTLDHFGVVLHHQVDKLMIRGGEWQVDFGISEFSRPIKIIVNGRFSLKFGAELIPVQEIVEDAIIKRLMAIFPGLNPAKEITFFHTYNDVSNTKYWYQPRDIEDLPDRLVKWANDTSAIVAYWPLTMVEKLTILLENFFYSQPFQPRYPYIGQDIKVMVLRRDHTLDATLCLPFISPCTPNRAFYEDQQVEIEKDLKNFAKELLGDQYKINIHLNTEDNNRYRKQIYLTPFGSCIGIGEEGVVGRGNNTLGIIPSYRPYSMEAPYGKNPTYHTGRILSILAPFIVQTLHNLTSQRVCALFLTLSGHDIMPPFATNIHLSGSFSAQLVEEAILNAAKDYDHLKPILEGALIPRSWDNQY